MKTSLTLGPCPVSILSSAVAFPSPALETAELLERLAPDLPAPRREALQSHLAGEIGVATRAHLAPGADPLTLPIDAARRALETSGADVAALLLATSTPTRWTTAESARVAQALGADVAICDLRSGCTGGLWALVEGARLARDAGAPTLVVACDSFSRAFSPNERMLPIAMGDGAAALVLASPQIQRAPPLGLVRAAFGAAPQLVDSATVRARLPPAVPPEDFVLSGDPEPFALATEAALLSAIESVAPPPDALLVPHVGRLATAHRLASRTGLDVYTDGFTRHGNLGAASLITALHMLIGALRSGRPVAQHVVLASAGGGLSFGAALWRLQTDDVYRQAA